jgi:hypothetical protein
VIGLHEVVWGTCTRKTLMQHLILCSISKIIAIHQLPSSPPELRLLTSTPQSSAASQGLFNNLTNQKRGSEDYGERRASYTEMAGNSPGLVSGWFNRTFKGHMDKPGASMGNDGKMMGLGSEQQKKEEKRGVME